MKVTITKETQFKTQKQRYNAYQGGNGVHVSDKYKGRKSKVGQRMKNSLKNYC